LPDSSQPARVLLLGREKDVAPPDREACRALGITGTLEGATWSADVLPDGGGWIVIPSGTPAEWLARTLVEVSRSPDAWSLLLLTQEEEGMRVLSISPGYALDPGEAARRIQGDGLDAGYLGHRRVLVDLSRIRHDVNNALTAGLAETQFMRMDAAEGSEFHEGLTIVEEQLEKIRDLVAQLSALRVASR